MLLQTLLWTYITSLERFSMTQHYVVVPDTCKSDNHTFINLPRLFLYSFNVHDPFLKLFQVKKSYRTFEFLCINYCYYLIYLFLHHIAQLFQIKYSYWTFVFLCMNYYYIISFLTSYSSRIKRKWNKNASILLLLKRTTAGRH